MKNKPLLFSIALISCLTFVVFQGCNNDRPVKKKGISYFIKGRLRTAEILTGFPFTLKLNYLSEPLYETHIGIYVRDSEYYHISYSLGNKNYSKDGVFGKQFADTNLKIRISPAPGITGKTLLNIRGVNYEFVVHNLQQ